jgi:ribosomal protein S27E
LITRRSRSPQNRLDCPTIVHHLPNFDPEEAKVQFPKLLNFIAEFMRRELGTLIENVLGRKWYRTAKHILAEWKRVLKEAHARANTEGHVLVEACPDCGGSGVLSLRGTQVFCHLCGSDDYEYQECYRCERQTVTSFDYWGEKFFCAKCSDEAAEEAGDLYISQINGANNK